MLEANKKQLKKIISKDRLDGYFKTVKHRNGDCDLLDAYLYYSWNTAVSESFYSNLQILEVALRNSIHNAANKHFENPYWFDEPSILRQREIQNIIKAKRNLRRQRKNIDPGRIIAELNFGFWTSLFYAHYEQSLWRPIIKKVFPCMPAAIRTRTTLSKRLDKIRNLRNRIFHYEPVWYYNLDERHNEITEVIDWIEPALKELLLTVDCYPDIKNPEYFQNLKDKLKRIF